MLSVLVRQLFSVFSCILDFNKTQREMNSCQNERNDNVNKQMNSDEKERNDKRNAEIAVWSILNAYLDGLKLMVERGINIHAGHEYLLRLAAHNKRFEIVQYLLDMGADMHADHDGALYHAAFQGHKKIVQLLLERGAVLQIVVRKHTITGEKHIISEENQQVFFDTLRHFQVSEKTLYFFACANNYSHILQEQLCNENVHCSI